MACCQCYLSFCVVVECVCHCMRFKTECNICMCMNAHNGCLIGAVTSIHLKMYTLNHIIEIRFSFSSFCSHPKYVNVYYFILKVFHFLQRDGKPNNFASFLFFDYTLLKGKAQRIFFFDAPIRLFPQLEILHFMNTCHFTVKLLQYCIKAFWISFTSYWHIIERKRETTCKKLYILLIWEENRVLYYIQRQNIHLHISSWLCFAQKHFIFTLKYTITSIDDEAGKKQRTSRHIVPTKHASIDAG